MSLSIGRPWGLVDWVLPKLRNGAWEFYGCVSTEERSLAAWSYFNRNRLLANTKMVRIADQVSRWTPRCEQKMSDNVQAFIGDGGSNGMIEDHAIIEPYSLIVESLNSHLGTGGGRYVLDITSLPKRFFFPLVKMLLKEAPTSVQDLIITYAYPRQHTAEQLAEAFEPYSALPMFSGRLLRGNPQSLIVGVGFEPLGLQCHIEQTEALREIKLLLPFPAPTRAFKRSWELLRRLQKHRAPETFQVFRVDVRDVSDVFNRVLSMTKDGAQTTEFAPYGPKTMSLGMCLYACLADSAASYSQPTVYHPDYSTGIGEVDGKPEIYCYCIRLNGRNLYEL